MELKGELRIVKVQQMAERKRSRISARSSNDTSADAVARRRSA
jgi:hypothetical protein